eukprot:16001648-Heterocapsa_arctica.AAC.1
MGNPAPKGADGDKTRKCPGPGSCPGPAQVSAEGEDQEVPWPRPCPGPAQVVLMGKQTDASGLHCGEVPVRIAREFPVCE